MVYRIHMVSDLEFNLHHQVSLSSCRSTSAPTHSRPLLTLYECVCDLTTATCIAKLASALLSYLLISIKKVICVPIVYPPDVRPDLAFLGGRAKSAPKIWVREAHTQAGPLLYQRF